MNWLLVLAIWMAVPNSTTTNLYWSSLERPAAPTTGGDFSAVQQHLQRSGVQAKPWTGAGFGEEAGQGRKIWAIVAGPNSKETDAASLKLLDQFTDAGGSVLILIRSDATDAGVSSLLRHYRVVLNPEPVPAKIQLLSSPRFHNLRFRSPPTRLLDAAEEALTEMILIPNDLGQPALPGSETDRPGFRMILGNRGTGRIAFVAGAESFANSIVGASMPAKDGKHDNLEIFLRLCRWLGTP